jgi:hypothetical protein
MPRSDLEDKIFFYSELWELKKLAIGLCTFGVSELTNFLHVFFPVVTLNSWMMSRLLSDCLLWVLSFIILENCREALRLDYLTLILRELTDPLKKMPKVVFSSSTSWMNSIFPFIHHCWSHDDIPSALLGVWNWSQTLLFFSSLENRDATQLMNDEIKFCFKNSHSWRAADVRN